jgi:hypothetical protein
VRSAGRPPRGGSIPRRRTRHRPQRTPGHDSGQASSPLLTSTSGRGRGRARRAIGCRRNSSLRMCVGITDGGRADHPSVYWLG